ncbi:RNA polymerase sigma factor [Sinomicrobium weinanense]|uniref:RNA polymerase sigma-70 factor n=1 Tax=Sinomicrobium weinanense TaxID=2842200 RepID=A0A926Q3N1_9FLAO|nr:RNA polymerase sigma-70 factor [Sinomicrobium weinanense]MBU3124805.1 RNA polymerase sigma-70 factor [Sinomicrobium weinanense]
MKSSSSEIISKKLLKGFSEGDRSAFRAIFELMEPRLYGFVFSYTKSGYIAEEIVQEVFIKVWERREEIRLSGSFSAFLYTMARNRTLNYLRNASQRAAIRDELWKNVSLLQEDVETEVIFSEYREIVDDIINHLPGKKRSIYIMSRQEGKTNAEIADILGISPKTVKNHLWKTFETIKIQLRPHLESTIKLLFLLSLYRFF